MFWKKAKKQAAAPQAGEKGEKKGKKPDARLHAESLGDVWFALTGHDPATLVPQVVGTVIAQGGTRPPWRWQHGGNEYVLMAWPHDQPVRAAVLMSGPEGGDLKPVTAVPLLEGLPNDLQVEAVRPRMEGLGGDVAVSMLEGKNPMWFFDPLFDRDKNDLTPGVTHTFWLAALALGIRKALLDELTIAQGPAWEAHVEEWLRENPDKKRQDAPPLKVDIKGRHFIMPGRFFGEYQVRAIVEQVQDCRLEKMPVKLLYLSFPFEDRPQMRLALYASRHVLGQWEPVPGEEVDAYVWLQGRIIDLEGAAPRQGGEE